jgi:HSP20 family protein
MNTLTRREERPVEEQNRTSYLRPPVNIFETKDHYVLEAEMPGVSKQGLDITVEGNELVISGRRSDGEVTGDVFYRESRPWAFRRVFELDPSIDRSKIGAKIEQGVLTLTLPKAEEVKPKRIKVD